MSSSASETFRLEAFADAVFAIAITLLVIEIRLPPHEEVLRLGGVGAALASLWPSYVGYAISFIVIGIMWANHHNLMKLVARVDHGFITLTLVLLMCVAFLPFPTAVMAEHLVDPDPHERAVAVAFYCGCFTVTAVFYFLMWLHAARGRRLIARCPGRCRARDYARLCARMGAVSASHAARVRARGREPRDCRRAGNSVHASEGRGARGCEVAMWLGCLSGFRLYVSAFRRTA